MNPLYFVLAGLLLSVLATVSFIAAVEDNFGAFILSQVACWVLSILIGHFA